jgi:hypothetical protein
MSPLERAAAASFFCSTATIAAMAVGAGVPWWGLALAVVAPIVIAFLITALVVAVEMWRGR